MLDQGKQKRFRKGEFEIVLQNLWLGQAATSRAWTRTHDWGLAAVGHDQRREVKSRRTLMIDGREAVEVETWNRLDHTNPQRFFFVETMVMLALHTGRMALRIRWQRSTRFVTHFISSSSPAVDRLRSPDVRAPIAHSRSPPG